MRIGKLNSYELLINNVQFTINNEQLGNFLITHYQY